MGTAATETTATSTTATDTSITETTGSGNPQRAAENLSRNTAKLGIAILLIVAALAFLIYLFRSGD
jgi:uncharacterized protein HemX